MRSFQTERPKIMYSCYFNVSRQGEHFVPDHIFSFQVSGKLEVNTGNETHVFEEGDFRFSRRNQLAKFVKTPPLGGEFKSISILLDQKTLLEISDEYGCKADKQILQTDVVLLKNHTLYQNYIASIMPYLEMPHSDNEALFTLKVREAILLLLKVNPELKDFLFDFTEPGKIDLEAFMQQNFHFNVGMKRYAYLTGRSLATFKRDFGKIFHTSPGHWLQHKRLQEAHYRIKEKGLKPSEVYLEVGFEDLSHFSYAFKKLFGVSPSKLFNEF